MSNNIMTLKSGQRSHKVIESGRSVDRVWFPISVL